MSDRTGDFIFVNGDDHIWASPFDNVVDATRQMGVHRRAWIGQVFFDHIRGVIDPAPKPRFEDKPYLLVASWRDFDWTSQHGTSVTEYDDPAALIAEAQKMVAAEKGSASSNYELWEVFGVRVNQRRPRARKPRRDDGITTRLVDAIRDAPDDDGPRLVWADAVGGERGELVVIQTELAKGTLAPTEALKLRRRQKELLARHGAAWSGLEGRARRVTFHRGFVDAAEISAPTFLHHADDIVEAAPLLSSITITEPRGQIVQLCVDPALRERMRGIDIVEPESGDHVIQTIVTAGLFRQLRALGISTPEAGGDGVRMLLGLRALHEIERLALRDYLQGDAIVALLNQGGLTSLRALELGSRFDMREVAPRLPSTLVELVADRLDAIGLLALADSPIAAKLERLSVVQDHIHSVGAFARLPRLRALTLYCAAENPPFLQAQVPALRELALRFGAAEPAAAIETIARTLGPQLDLLDLRGSRTALRHVNTLKPLVAGELLVGTLPERRDLVRAVPTLHAQWWDHVSL